MAMNRQRRTSNISNIFSYDDAGNIVIKDYSQVIRYSWNGTIHGFVGPLSVSSVSAATTDTDKFLVSDGGVLKYRTGAEVLSDIGGQPVGSYVPTSRTLTINGTAYDLSADRSWTVSSDNIYTADGTLTGNRTVTSGGNSLTILGGKEVIVGEQTALVLQTSATNKGLVELQLNNTFTTTGKNWRIRSLSDGALDFAVSSTRVLYFSSNGKVIVNGSTPISSANFSVNGEAAIASGLQVQGGLSSPTGAGFELEYSGGVSYITSYNRTGGAWLPINLRALQIDLTTAGSVRARLTAAGRLLLGTTTESTFIFDAVGIGRYKNSASGETIGLRLENGTSASTIGLDLVGGPLSSTAASARLQGTDLGGWQQGFNIKIYDGTGGGAGSMVDRYLFAKDYFNLTSVKQIKQSGTGAIDNLWISNGSDALNTLSGISFGQFKKTAIYSIVSTSALYGVSDIVFALNNTTTSNQAVSTADEKMRLTRNGRLLLGTSTESTYLLDVNGTARVSGQTTISVSSANPLILNRGVTSTAAIYLDGASNICAYGNGTDVGGAGSEFLYLNRATNSVSIFGNSSEKFRIFSTGNLLLQNGGTFTDAGYRLDVNGTARVSGAIRNTGTNENIIIHILNESQSVGYRSVLVGRTQGTVSGVGVGFSVQSAGGVSIGATVTSGNGVSIGNSSATTGGATLGLGSTSLDGVSVGTAAISNFQGIAIGNSVRAVATSSSTNAIAIGNFSYSVDAAFVSGSSVRPITDVYFGSGISNLRGDGVQTTGAGTFYTINGSGAFGTDFAGGNITIAGGKGTGSGTSGDVIISTATPTTSGTTLQTLTQRVWVKGDNGNVGIGAIPNASYKLDVSGTSRIVGKLFASSGNTMPAFIGTQLGTGNWIDGTSSTWFAHIGHESPYAGFGTVSGSNIESAFTWFYNGNSGNGFDVRSVDFGNDPRTGVSLLTVKQGGNVLIGTTSDQGYRCQITSTSADAHLSVWGTSAPSIRIDNAGSSATQRFVLGLATATNNFIIGAVAGDICMTTQSSSPLLFGANATEVMRITTSNNLLIGTNADAGYRLDVNGTSRLNGQAYVNGNLLIGLSAGSTAWMTIQSGSTSKAQINLSNSTAPTSPSNGDIWFDGSDLKIQIGGVTKTVTVT